MKYQFDAISIGSGLGGLAAAAKFALEGHKVQVLERHTVFGGAATAYSRKKFNIEVGLHETAGPSSEKEGDYIYDTLGLRSRLKFVNTGNFFCVNHASLGDCFVMPDGVNSATDALQKRFPNHIDAIDVYFDTLAKIRNSVYHLNKLEGNVIEFLKSLVKLPSLLWPLIKYEKTTLGFFLNQLFGDDESIKFALCANLCYYADNPNDLSLIFFATAQDAYHRNGSCFIHGGSQNLSNELVSIIKQAGGEVLPRRQVTDILVKNGRAVGVRHEKSPIIGSKKSPTELDAQESIAPVIFGNADPIALSGLLPAPYSRNFFDDYKDLKSSVSLWSLYLVFNRPPSAFGVRNYSTFHFPAWSDSLEDMKDYSRVFNSQPNGKMPGFVFVDYSSIDSGLDNDDAYLGVMLGTDKLENWDNLDDNEYTKRKSAWVDALIDQLENYYPGITESIILKEMGTARTMKTYLNTRDGAVYGFAQTPHQSGRHRPKVKTKLDGLWLASAWGMPGGGYTGALWCGLKAAEQALRASRR